MQRKDKEMEYTAPVVQIIAFGAEDVITESTQFPDDGFDD